MTETLERIGEPTLPAHSLLLTPRRGAGILRSLSAAQDQI